MSTRPNKIARLTAVASYLEQEFPGYVAAAKLL